MISVSLVSFFSLFRLFLRDCKEKFFFLFFSSRYSFFFAREMTKMRCVEEWRFSLFNFMSQYKVPRSILLLNSLQTLLSFSSLSVIKTALNEPTSLLRHSYCQCLIKAGRNFFFFLFFSLYFNSSCSFISSDCSSFAEPFASFARSLQETIEFDINSCQIIRHILLFSSGFCILIFPVILWYIHTSPTVVPGNQLTSQILYWLQLPNKDALNNRTFQSFHSCIWFRFR